VVAAAPSFVDAIRPEDALAVVMFADKSTMLQDLSTDRDRSYEAIDEYRANGGTALYDALADSLIRLKRVEGRRAIVVVTDGRDEDNPGTGPGSARSFDDVLARLKEAGATVFGVGLGSKVDQRPLEELAKLSGGQAYFPADVGSLPENYARIVENLRRRFALSYTSTHAARDGKWRKVEIRVRDSKLLVSSPGGYFAPDR
jgi:Ca-activated chloride channel family protein